MKKIITIEPVKRSKVNRSIPTIKKRRVAGYARVSTDQEEQQSSYDTQMVYYQDYIASRHDWEFVKMYSDEGISGTNTKRRLGFQQMVEDALNGKIDLIITKSVSRFARNTVDSLTTVRQLKDAGVEIYFEKENIWTFDAKGELLITIMSSLAQEESRSISENVTWSKRKLVAEGKVSFSYSTVLGFKQTEDGFTIDEEEAKVVRRIFQMFLQGDNPNNIAKILTQENISTPGGKTVWSYGTVKRILQNEKYKGDVLLQKEYTADFLTKKRKVNQGELPQYYVENNHEAIIDKETFDMVQIEIAKRDAYAVQKNYYGKLQCSCCGGKYGVKTWHPGSRYMQRVYQCLKKYKLKCSTPTLKSKDIDSAFIQAFNQVYQVKNEIIENVKLLIGIVSDTSELDRQLEIHSEKLSTIERQVEELVMRNAKVVQNQDAYQTEYDSLCVAYETEKELYRGVQEKLLENQERVTQLKNFIIILKKQDKILESFDFELFHLLIDKVVVDDKLSFYFKEGTVVSI